MNRCPIPYCLRTLDGTIVQYNNAFKMMMQGELSENTLNINQIVPEDCFEKLFQRKGMVGQSQNFPGITLVNPGKQIVCEYSEAYFTTETIECYFYSEAAECPAKEDMFKKKKYLHGLNVISQLLIGGNNYHTQMNEILRNMGELTEANRVYIFENYFHEETQTTYTNQIFEWVSNPVLAQIDNPDLREFPLELATPVTYNTFLRGESYCGVRSEFIPELKEVLEAQDIYSILFLPLFVDEKFWGFIGLDHCYEERLWDEDDLSLLSQVALNISLYISRSFLERANQEYKERLNSALTAGKIGIWDWNLTDNSVIYSRMVAEMLGYTEQEFGKGFSAWESKVHSDDLNSVSTLIANYLSGEGKEYISEHRLKAKDGSWRWVLDKGRVVEYSDEGKPLRMVGTHTDITELRILQEKVVNSLQSFHSLFSVNPLPILIVDPERMVIITANESAKEKYGTSIFQSQPAELAKVLADEDKETFYEALVRNQDDFSKTIWRHRDGNGHSFFATCSVHQIFYEGKDALIVAISDVSQKIASEIQLLASEERLKAIIAAMPDMMFVLSMDGVYEEYYSPESNNPSLAAPREYFIGKRVMDVLPGYLADEFYREFEIAKKGEKMGWLNYELDLPVGKQYFEARMTTITSKQKILCIVRNMTEKNIAEKKLKESEEKLRVVAQNIPHGTVNLFDGDMRLLYSEGDKELTFPPECIGCIATDDCPGCRFEENRDHFNSALSGEEVRFETEINKKKYLTYINPIRDSFDNVKYIIQMSTEITEYRNQQDELFATRQRLEGLVRAMLDGVYIFDLKSSKLLFANEIVVLLSGISLEELYQNPISWFHRIHPEDRLQYLETIKSVRVRLRGSCEYRILNAEEKYIWVVERTWCVTDENGAPQRIEGLISDISRHKKSEEEIKDALAKERELSVLKSKFISNTSHEFRTPLAVIQSSVNILENYSQRLNEEQKLFQYNRINESIANLTQMLEEVLYLEKANANKLVFDPQGQDIHQLCLRIIADVMSEKQTVTQIIIDDHLTSRYFELDQRLFYTIVSNLLKNAVKYSPSDKLITVTLTDDEAGLYIEIKDQGIGIPEDEINMLFEPFFRASNAEEYSGTGLGLPIVKKAIELHNGAISVKSKLGEGSTFVITLPHIVTKESVVRI